MSDDFNKLKPFRFWCQKVLPLVYDESLSYYELLCKVVDYLNKTIEDVNSVIDLTETFTEEQSAAYTAFTTRINETVASLTESFNTLQAFVDNYFDNLDVQEEINVKLDEMSSDGTLSNMVRPVAAAMIPGLVAQWLEDNITPTTPAVDRTLSVTGAAADAREVGYRLAWVGDSLNWVNNSKYDVATGEIGENNDYARTPRIKGNLNEIIGIRSFASVPDAHAVLLYKNSNYIGYFTYATVEGNENYFYFLPDGTVTTAIEHDEYAINWIKNETYPVYDWTLRRTKLAGDVTELKNEALNADLSLEVMGSGQAELKNIPLIISSFINAETGAFTPTTTDNWAGTDFIEIPEGCYKITSNATAPSANFGLAFYDKDKQFISGSGVATYPAIDIRVELNYKYIRFTNYNADGDHSNVQLFFLGNKYGLYNEDNAPLELAIGNATLLRGSYTLNSTVTLGENQQIRGADCTVVVGENGKIIMSDGSAISGVNFVGEWNPTRTHGNGTTYTSYGYVPLIDYSDLETGDSDALFGENKTVSDAVIYIPTTGAFNAKVEGCTFTGFDRLAIYAGGQRHTENDNPVICNNYFVDCRMGVYVASEFTRLSCNEYLRCIVGCTLLGGNGNNVGEVYKCCDCGFYFPTPGTAHNEITSCEFAHCGLAGVYIQEIIARAGAQITGCQFADAPITGLSVNNVDIVGCRIDTWISYQNGKGNSIICSNIGNAYMYSHVELFDVPGDTVISFNRGLGTVADSDVNWKLSEIESIEDDVAGLKEDISDTNDRINNIVSSSFDLTDIRSLNGVQELAGYYGSAGSVSIILSTTSSYKTYYVYLTEPISLYYSDATIASTRYARLCTIENAEAITEYGTNQYIIRGTNPQQYERATGTLPDSDHPLTLPAGACLVFSEGNTSGVWEIYTASDEYINAKQIDYIKKQLDIKKCYLQYVGEAGADASTARLSVYIPTVSGYVRYDFLHSVSASINADVWRVGYAYHTDDSFNVDYPLTAAGEWECAIKIKNRDDYSGGFAHGDEIMNSVLFIIDGVPNDITTYTTLTEFTDLEVFESSNLYDPNDSTTIYAVHGSEHHFTKDGLTIRQSVKFSLPETVTYVYLAMLPLAKAVSNYIIPDKDFIPLSTDNAIRIYDTERTVIYKSDGTVKAIFAVPKWVYLNTSDYTFFCLDNGSTTYNKCYFNNNVSSYDVPAGTLLKTETFYNFVISEE